MITVRDAIDAYIKSRTMFLESMNTFESAWAAPTDRATSRMLIGQMKDIPEFNTPELSEIENELGGNNAKPQL